MAGKAAVDLKIRLHAGGEIALGPGKADLLEAIGREGSISGAGRAMDMSYRRAWLLVDTMNRRFAQPLVETHPGSKGSGARITPFGATVLANYRALQAKAMAAVEGAELAELLGSLGGQATD